MKIIVGLGNSGKRYTNTRHNAGVIMLRSLAQYWGVQFKNHGGIAEVGHYENGKDAAWLIFPTQLMNNSGPALVQALESLRINPQPKNILVLHDELDMSLGTAKLSFARGSAGHNGVESIMKALGGRVFWRLRIGIHPGKPITNRTEYVLDRMSKEEQETLDTLAEQVHKGIGLWLNKPHEAVKFLNTQK